MYMMTAAIQTSKEEEKNNGKEKVTIKIKYRQIT